MPRGVYSRKKKADEVAAAEADGFHQADADGPIYITGQEDVEMTDIPLVPDDVVANVVILGTTPEGGTITGTLRERYAAGRVLADEADTPENIDDALGESSWVPADDDEDDGPQPGPDRGPLSAGSDAAMSELEARGRAGIRVTDYGPGGEARDYEVERPEPAPPAPQASTTAVTTSTSTDAPLMRQLMLDGFPEQQVAHEAAINIAGRIVLNLNSSADQARWRSLPLGQRVIVSLAAIVVARIGRLSLDADLQDKKRLASASLKVVGMHGDAVEAEPDDDDDDSDSGTALADLAAAAHQLLARPHLTTDAATEFIERVAAHGRAVALRCEECGERGATFRARYDGDLCDSCYAKRQDLDDLDADYPPDPVDGEGESELTKALAEAAADGDDDDDGDA